MQNLFRRYGRATAYLMITDWLILVGAFGVALHLCRYDPGLNIISRFHIAAEVLFVFVFAFFMVGFFGALGLYKRRVLLSPVWHVLRILGGIILCVTSYLLIQSATKSPLLIPSRLVLLNWAVIQCCVLLIHRIIIFPVLARAATKTNMQRRVVIIGTGEESVTLAQQMLDQERFALFKPIGFLSDHQSPGSLIVHPLTCLGQVGDLSALVNSHKIEGAVITQTDLSYQELMNLIERCVRLFGWVDVHTDQSAVWHKNLPTDTYFDIPFVRMREISDSSLIRMYKEATDIIGSLIGILLLSPVLIATAVAIKLTSPGPVFYTRERVGKGGKLFRFYKFRSMTVGADQDQTRTDLIREHMHNPCSAVSKIVNTTYITPVGKFIRKWAIDELPQLFNVLKGDMSLIGPRPVPQNEHEMADEWHKKRFEIKPGCTGLWKVYAAKAGVSFNETVLYDLYYARNMNPFLDAYIIFMTAWVILTGRADE